MKLFVTDLDGTLLRDDMRFSPKLKDVLQMCKEKNAMFCVCTGRQIFNVKKLFDGYEGIEYITNNGTHFELDGKEVFFEIPKREIDAILQVLDRHHYEVYAETQQGVVIQSSQDTVFLNEVGIYCENIRTVNHLSELDEAICKITITCDFGLQQALKQFEHLQDRLNIAISGSRWIDIMPKGCNKASAIRYLQQLKQIKDENIVVFGDYLNDLEMLRENQHSYAMLNAHPEAKKAATYVLPYTNNEDGVIKKMIELLEEV